MARNYASVVPVTPDRSLTEIDPRVIEWLRE